MKKPLLALIILLFSMTDTYAQIQYKIITSIESIAASSSGNSRLISSSENRDYNDFTAQRTDKDNTRNKSKEKDIRVTEFEETKLLNFYSFGDIRYQNVAANDAVITSKLNTMTDEGWELAFVTSAVESDAGTGDGTGVFITRYIFKRQKQ